jgi:hypothetical protein
MKSPNLDMRIWMPNRTFKHLFIYKCAHFLSLEINYMTFSFQKHDEKATVFRDQCFQEFGPSGKQRK